MSGFVRSVPIDIDATMAANSDSRVASQKATKTRIAALLDTDGTLAADSDALAASQKATRTYVAAAVAAVGAPTITTANFAAGITPVEIVATLPVTGNFQGRTVFLTTDSKLYRYTGSAWTSVVPAVDITGQLTDAQLADLAAAKLTGQITSTQITDGSISTPKLAAGSVTTAKLVANAVTANEVAAGAITTAKLDAGAVTTTKLAANAVTANELAANSVVAGKIAAAAIGTTELAAGAVVAGKISVANLAAIVADMGAITAGTLTLDTSGHVKGGMTAYQTGIGFFLGYSGGAYKFSIGNPAGQYLTWDGVDLTITGKFIHADTFSGSISGSIGGTTTAGTPKVLGSKTVSVSGGTAPYTYEWSILWQDNPNLTGHTFYLTGGTGATVGVSAGEAVLNDEFTGRVQCLITDARGRVTVAAFNVGVTIV
jgi:hypothetical protein